MRSLQEVEVGRRYNFRLKLPTGRTHYLLAEVIDNSEQQIIVRDSAERLHFIAAERIVGYTRR